MALPTTFMIMRDDGLHDGISGQSFTSFDEAFIVLESYYSDTCCSDESEIYRIVEVATDR